MATDQQKRRSIPVAIQTRKVICESSNERQPLEIKGPFNPKILSKYKTGQNKIFSSHTTSFNKKTTKPLSKKNNGSPVLSDVVEEKYNSDNNCIVKQMPSFIHNNYVCEPVKKIKAQPQLSKKDDKPNIRAGNAGAVCTIAVESKNKGHALKRHNAHHTQVHIPEQQLQEIKNQLIELEKENRELKSKEEDSEKCKDFLQNEKLALKTESEELKSQLEKLQSILRTNNFDPVTYESINIDDDRVEKSRMQAKEQADSMRHDITQFIEQSKHNQPCLFALKSLIVLGTSNPSEGQENEKENDRNLGIESNSEEDDMHNVVEISNESQMTNSLDKATSDIN